MLRYLLAIATCFAFIPSDAKILRVGIDYGDFNSAQAAASPGDTLQIYGSHNGSTSKRLVIIGFGYNFDVHPGLQAIGTDAPSQLNITFNNGSDSSIVEGIEGNVYIHTHKIIVRRCKTYVYMYNSSRTLNDIKILSTVFNGGGLQSNNNFGVNNLLVYNTIFVGAITLYGPASTGAIINCTSHFSGSPNVLDLRQANILVKNCILWHSNYPNNANTVYESNFFMEPLVSPAPQGSNNRWSQSVATIFNRLGGTSNSPSYGHDGSFDENWFVLKAGSPAIGGGTTATGAATDCGIFGGEPVYLYRLSGVPAVPSIYKLTAPSSAATSDPYNVTISVRSNN